MQIQQGNTNMYHTSSPTVQLDGGSRLPSTFTGGYCSDFTVMCVYIVQASYSQPGGFFSSEKHTLHCRKSWWNISSPPDISELFHEDITTNISEKYSP
jgi:hypothetical protein